MSSSNATFDPLGQNITMLAADGVTKYFTTPAMIDAWYYFNIQSTIVYATQLGACLIMFFVTMLLTKASKRCTPVFILNLISLFLGFLRALFLILYFDNGWSEFLSYFTYNYNNLSRIDYGDSVVTEVINGLFVSAIASSLVLQAWTVTKAISRKWHLVLTVVSILVLLLLAGTRFAVSILNIIAIMNKSVFGLWWLRNWARAMECLMIWWFTLIFTGKLVYTLWSRKRMGLKAWSYLQILVVMGSCTMFIPSIFAIFDLITLYGFPESGSLALCSVALLLPLSSLWASSTNEPNDTGLTTSWASRQKLTCKDCGGKSFADTTTAVTSKVSHLDRKASNTPPTTNRIRKNCTSNNSRGRDSTELDLQSMGVRIDRSYSVHSEKGPHIVDV